MSSLTNKLISISAHEAIYRTSLGRHPAVVPWSPEKPWNGSDTAASFTDRYHHFNQAIAGDILPPNPELYSAGSMVEEGPIQGEPAAWDSVVLKVLRDWIGDPSWTPTLQDKMDLKLVKDPDAQDAVFNARILPLIRQATGAASQGGSDTTAPSPSTTPPAGKVATAGGTATADASAAKILSALADLKKLRTSVQGHGGKPMREIEHQLDHIISGLGG